MKAANNIKRVLVANRGEVATRIAKTLRALDIVSVGLCIDSEKNAPYLDHFDHVHTLSENKLSAFLHMDELIALARRSQADAIHPGYGFLSENATFAQKVADAGLVWIGPPADVVAQLGNKEQAKNIARTCNVPVLENVFESVEEDPDFAGKVASLQFPVIIKPLLGGGGKGMQILYNADDMSTKMAESRTIAKAAFGNGRLMAECYIENPKHIEIQVLRDQHGNAFTLGERDCTIQRRHQKIIEESPSIAIDEQTRQAICQDALTLIDQVGYTNVGTVEFLLDPAGKHYFMEVNTRLQVEHVVTEMVYDVDLVACQIAIAQGEEIDLADAKACGHAIEVRVYAENSDVDFLPATGMLSHVELPMESKAVRVDHNTQVGQHITSMFDPLLLKLTVWGPTREHAITELLAQMKQLQLVGVVTNQSFIAWVLQHEDFATHKHHTQWVDDVYSDYVRMRGEVLQGALLAWHHHQWQKHQSSWHHDPWNSYQPRKQSPHMWVTWNQTEISTERDVSRKALKTVDYQSYQVGLRTWIFFDNQCFVFLEKDVSRGEQAGSDETRVKAPMTGTIVKIHASAGDQVEKDQVLIEMEAMKMQYKLTSPTGGIVEQLHCKPNEVVNQDQVLLEVSR